MGLVGFCIAAFYFRKQLLMTDGRAADPNAATSLLDEDPYWWCAASIRSIDDGFTCRRILAFSAFTVVFLALVALVCICTCGSGEQRRRQHRKMRGPYTRVPAV